LRCSWNREHVSYPAIARELSPANFIAIGSHAALINIARNMIRVEPGFATDDVHMISQEVLD
jgi:hypothetical protein